MVLASLSLPLLDHADYAPIPPTLSAWSHRVAAGPAPCKGFAHAWAPVKRELALKPSVALRATPPPARPWQDSTLILITSCPPRLRAG